MGTFVSLHAIEQAQLRRQHRVDAVRRCNLRVVDRAVGFLSLEERGALGGARLHHGVQRCCQGPGLVSIIRRRSLFTRSRRLIYEASSWIMPSPTRNVR